LIIEVRPNLPADFAIAPWISSVQFCRRLSVDDYSILAKALQGRPDVCLRVYGYEYTDIDFLANFAHVRQLQVDCWTVSNFDGILAIRELDSLVLGWTEKKSQSLRFLACFPTVRRLHVEGHRKDIDVIAELSNIEHLSLRSITLPDIALLTALPRLRCLEIKLGGTSQLQALPLLTQLRYLELWLVRGLSDLSMLARMTQLEVLCLQALKKVVELPSFRELRGLRGVWLETMKGLYDLSPVADAPALEVALLINMPHIKIDDIRSFAGHPTLRAFRAGLGSLRRNAEALRVVGVSGDVSAFRRLRNELLEIDGDCGR
jgi:hypothetical protein